MSATGTGSVLFALVLLLTLCSLRATPLDCSGPCRCVLEEIPTCPVGVTLVKDGCGCCPVCAKQLGDVCTKRDVCDKRKDLYCSFELPTEPNIGVCRAKEGASCYIEGTEHKDGETFQKSCTEMCTCRSGKKGKRCLRASNMTYPIRLKVDECISVNRFNVKICGVCIDGGCCTPKHTTTERVKFRCPDDEFTEKNVMFIQACRCHYRYSQIDKKDKEKPKTHHTGVDKSPILKQLLRLERKHEPNANRQYLFSCSHPLHNGAMSATGTGSVLFALVLLLTLCSWRATPLDCSGPCRCVLEEAPTCPVGMTLVKDGCGCCPMCTKQLGDVCTKRDVCDERKDLYCTFDLPTEPNIGVCRAKEGASCSVEGKEHTDGETFQRGCRGMCTCRSGEVSCEPLCPPSIRLPSPDCPFPQLVKIPGKCCEEWVCDEPKDDTMSRSALADFVCFVLMAYQREEAVTPEPRTLQRNCQVQTTEWGACSNTCSLGISTRYTNDNAECREEQQTRLCFLRPCNADLEKKIKEGESCILTTNLTYPIKFPFDGCVSVKNYHTKICGVCTYGRCCTPERTTTEPVKSRYLDGRDVTKINVMFIKACGCHYNCPVGSNSFESLF
ncbi:CCN family member 2-like [Tenrec ecaudatus]|uniref:CCN family member 2-like n=1 Tax=Tenrec ecaudatus TaxID=94439 RepID=UPI003F599263